VLSRYHENIQLICVDISISVELQVKTICPLLETPC